MTTSFVRLASGVALFATASGLLARTPRRWSRIGLGDREKEKSLVARLARGPMAITPDDANTARVLLGKGILVHGEESAPMSAPRFPEHVLVGAPDDAAMGARLLERARSGRPSLVLWIDERGIAAAKDDGATPGCPLCAWSYDSAAARYITPAGDLAGSLRAFADADRFARRSVLVVDAARALDPRCVWTIGGPDAAPVTTTIAPHPSCLCAARPRAHERAATWSPPADWRGASSRHAPIWPIDEDDARVTRVVFRRSRTPWSTRTDALGVALGTGTDPRAAAIGEAIERFAMLHAPPGRVERRGDELDVPPLEPALVDELLFRADDYALEGFRFRPYEPGAVQDWTVASSLLSGVERAVPASVVGRARVGETALADVTSNGYAAHHDRDRAIHGALLELVERDAILLDAYAPLSEIVRLDDAGGPPGCSTFLVTQDVDLPVVLALKIGENGALRAGSAAATTLEAAVARAHAELAVALEGNAPERPARALDEVRSRYEPDDHLATLRGAVASATLAATLARSRSLPCSAVRDRWPDGAPPRVTIVHALTAVGLEPWIADRSLPAVFGEGWHVVRALVPGLVELSWGLPYRRLRSRRIAARLAAGVRLSTSPHPIA